MVTFVKDFLLAKSNFMEKGQTKSLLVHSSCHFLRSDAGKAGWIIKFVASRGGNYK